MEKLLVSDYDDTIKTSNVFITKLNFNAIKKFRENGNKFVVASGRDYKSLSKALSFYNCEYDGLICNDGSVGFDSNGKVIYEQKLDENLVNNLSYYFDNNGNKYIYHYQMYNSFGYTSTNKNIIEFVIVPKLFKNIKPLIKEIQTYFPDLHINKFNNAIYIRKNYSKSDGIKIISKNLNILKENIYTIGDWKNDYEMIRDYNGYNVFFSHPSLYKVSDGTVTSVSHLVKKLKNKWFFFTIHLFLFQIDYYINYNNNLFYLIILHDYLVQLYYHYPLLILNQHLL